MAGLCVVCLATGWAVLFVAVGERARHRRARPPVEHPDLRLLRIVMLFTSGRSS